MAISFPANSTLNQGTAYYQWTGTRWRILPNAPTMVTHLVPAHNEIYGFRHRWYSEELLLAARLAVENK